MRRHSLQNVDADTHLVTYDNFLLVVYNVFLLVLIPSIEAAFNTFIEIFFRPYLKIAFVYRDTLVKKKPLIFYAEYLQLI